MQLINPKTGEPYTNLEATRLYYAASERYKKAKGRKTAWDRDQQLKVTSN